MFKGGEIKIDLLKTERKKERERERVMEMVRDGDREILRQIKQ